jgi:hypothetical protein
MAIDRHFLSDPFRMDLIWIKPWIKSCYVCRSRVTPLYRSVERFRTRREGRREGGNPPTEAGLAERDLVTILSITNELGRIGLADRAIIYEARGAERRELRMRQNDYGKRNLHLSSNSVAMRGMASAGKERRRPANLNRSRGRPRFCLLEHASYDLLSLLLDLPQMILIPKALGIDLVNFLCTG